MSPAIEATGELINYPRSLILKCQNMNTMLIIAAPSSDPRNSRYYSPKKYLLQQCVSQAIEAGCELIKLPESVNLICVDIDAMPIIAAASSDS